jgi:hypothetical protein
MTATGIPGNGLGDASHMLEDAPYAPETPSGQDCDLRLAWGLVEEWRGNGGHVLVRG